MKTKFLQRVLWLMIPLLTIFSTNVWGASESINANSGVYSGSGATGICTWTMTSCSVVHAKGPNSSTNVDSSNKGRWYKDNTITFTPKSGYTISQIVLAGSSESYNGQTMTVSGGGSLSVSSNTTTWTGTATSAIVLTMGKQFRFGSVTITYSYGGGGGGTGIFSRISNVSDLSDGDEIIFVNQAETYTCSTTQNSNNRGTVSITTSNHTYTKTADDNVQVFTVKIYNSNYGFHAGDGYIYSPGANNYLRTNTTAISTNPSGSYAWTLSASSNVFTCLNAQNNTYYLAFNGNSIFSKYASSMTKPYIYRKQGSSTYTVTYNANNATSGTVPTDATAYSSGATVTVKGNTGNLARTGYTFGGWNTQADGNGTNYAAGSGTFTISTNTTLYAKWNPTYTVTYNGNGNNSGSVPVDGSSPYSANATVTVLGNTGNLAKTGWTFAGWNTNSTGTGTNRAAGSTFSITANTTLYAKWTCTVTWSVDGHDDVYSQQTITYNPSGSKVSSVPTPNPASYCGQVFAGWTTAAIDGTQGSAPTPLFKTIGDSPDLNSTGSVTFYAVFADYAP